MAANAPLTRARIAYIDVMRDPRALTPDDVRSLLAAAQFVATIAERRCRCDEIATCDFGDRCDACRARALVKL